MTKKCFRFITVFLINFDHAWYFLISSLNQEAYLKHSDMDLYMGTINILKSNFKHTSLDSSGLVNGTKNTCAFKSKKNNNAVSFTYVMIHFCSQICTCTLTQQQTQAVGLHLNSSCQQSLLFKLISLKWNETILLIIEEVWDNAFHSIDGSDRGTVKHKPTEMLMQSKMYPLLCHSARRHHIPSLHYDTWH